jgi:hypothetical protein
VYTHLFCALPGFLRRPATRRPPRPRFASASLEIKRYAAKEREAIMEDIPSDFRLA